MDQSQRTIPQTPRKHQAKSALTSRILGSQCAPASAIPQRQTSQPAQYARCSCYRCRGTDSASTSQKQSQSPRIGPQQRHPREPQEGALQMPSGLIKGVGKLRSTDAV